MPAPDKTRFTATHEWILASGDHCTVGISDHAQSELGDVVYIELPAPGRTVAAKEAVAVIESVKAASDIYAPVAGEIVEVNGEVSGNSGLVNSDPYGAGWLFKIKPARPADLEALMDETAYLAGVSHG
jgi:glycine cleavage system H protein